jgi:hypothetical protein
MGTSLLVQTCAYPDLRIQRSGTAIGGIAELTAFKLQWNCPDRNIDPARRWGKPRVLFGKRFGEQYRTQSISWIGKDCTASLFKRILLK